MGVLEVSTGRLVLSVCAGGWTAARAFVVPTAEEWLSK